MSRTCNFSTRHTSGKAAAATGGASRQDTTRSCHSSYSTAPRRARCADVGRPRIEEVAISPSLSLLSEHCVLKNLIKQAGSGQASSTFQAKVPQRTGIPGPGNQPTPKAKRRERGRECQTERTASKTPVRRLVPTDKQSRNAIPLHLAA